MRSAMCGNRSLIGRQLRVDSFGRSGAAVEIGLGGSYEAIQGVLSRFVSPYMIVQLYMARGREISSVGSVKFYGDACSRKKDWEI